MVDAAGMGLPIDVLITRLFLLVIVSSASGMKSRNDTKTEAEGPLLSVTHTRPAIARNNSTGYSPTIQSSTPTITTREQRTNHSIATTPFSERVMTSQPTSVTREIIVSSSRPFADKAGNQKGIALLVVLPVVSVILLAVGVALVLYWVRRKRILRVKEGFKDEMATICLHDELALESLQTSWKPFLETGDNKEIRLVLGISG